MRIFALIYACVLFFAGLFALIRIYKKKPETNGNGYKVLMLAFTIGYLFHVLSAASLGISTDPSWWNGFWWSLGEVAICLLCFYQIYWKRG